MIRMRPTAPLMQAYSTRAAYITRAIGLQHLYGRPTARVLSAYTTRLAWCGAEASDCVRECVR